ncbi:Protein TIC 62 like [Actinidia chinensis var. chinensis]|uniref:Protein TIC 62 like n=1 Tax=Actinidia chinensis var. chinensis TaxID=1590841 RepID=A0A2R6RHC8_ACTCC|nr:Protein TIC 62 like [Actinidia chinensis var. chinensis]
MELRCLQSPNITGIPSTVTQIGLREKSFVSGQVIKIHNFKKYTDASKIKFIGFRAPASGSTKFSSGAVEAIPKDANSKDENLVFVAGATGRVGSRTVRELLKLGFKVRAGVRSAQRAESLLQSVQQMKLGDDVASEGTKPIEKLEIVECDLEKRDQIEPALGNASVVICCIGASEKEVFDITGPYRIDYQATKNLIDAATVAKVKHFILLTSLGTNKIGFPAAILNLFWGVLIWKRKAEEVLLASGLPYTIVRPGGMERPTDAYKETHNITLSEEDTLFGGQVSNLQVAEFMAFMAKNRSLSYCKVVEVVAETTAPLTPMGELLVKIPSQRVEVKPLKKPPSTPVEKEPATEKSMSTASLSPYIVYEDLKPPTSPSPTPSTSARATQVNSSETPTDKQAAETEEKTTSPLSPYTTYDALRPPTSPSPNAPNGPVLLSSSSNGGSQMTTVLVNNTPQAFPTYKPGDEPHQAEPKPRPLSPFTMYEDLKPPTSPTPSPRSL